MVFNGPFYAALHIEPAYIFEPMDLSNSGMFYGGPRPKPWRLLVGPFECEGRLLIPRSVMSKYIKQDLDLVLDYVSCSQFHRYFANILNGLVLTM